MKHSLADRTEKLKRCEVVVEILVEACLVKRLQCHHKRALHDAIQVRATAFSYCYHLTSVGIPNILKECFHGAEESIAVTLPDLTC